MKIKCNFIGMKIESAWFDDNEVARFLIHPDELGLFTHDMSQYKDKDLLTIEVKKYKPLRTLTQNAFFHKTVGYLAFKLGMDAGLVKEGVKDIYGYKIKGIRGNLVPKPSHLCSKFEEMQALIEGVFLEAGVQGVDMRDYIHKWEQYKKERNKTLDKNTIV